MLYILASTWYCQAVVLAVMVSNFVVASCGFRFAVLLISDDECLACAYLLPVCVLCQLSAQNFSHLKHQWFVFWRLSYKDSLLERFILI